jgi:hypothetical protein
LRCATRPRGSAVTPKSRFARYVCNPAIHNTS